MKTVKITHEGLASLLELNSDEFINGCTFVSLVTFTKPKLKGGKSNPLNGLLKYSVRQGMLTQDKNSNAYENMVKRRMEELGYDSNDFQVQPRTWGEAIKNSPVIGHTPKSTGQYTKYLRVIEPKNAKVENTYFLNGKVVSKKEVNEQLYVAPSKKDSQGGLKAADYGVKYFNPKFENIIELTINKTKYSVV